mmetsp:Transcript_1997/g.3651  ORF Transcript_1997/g.3651 Transcript_1997/m.3651 type:complete len:464 (-) Transcript_1997:70-1461(-)
MGIKDAWTSDPPHKRSFPNRCLGISKLTKGHVELIHQWAERGPLIEGYFSRRVHLFGCFFAYFRGTLLWQWELWVNFLVLCVPLFVCIVWYEEPKHHYVKHCVEIFHDWVSGYSRFFLGLFVSLVLSRYFRAFSAFGAVFGSTQNLSLSVSTMLQPASDDDDNFIPLRDKLQRWITLGWAIMALQAHFSRDEWVDYLKTKGYMTDSEWALLSSLGKYDRGALVYKWIDRALMLSAQSGRILYPQSSLIKIMDRVASARGAALSFDLGWIIQLPYAYVVMISSMVKLLMLCEATILGMDYHLADLLDAEHPGEEAKFPKWFIIGLQVAFIMFINMVLYSAVSLQSLMENPWGSAVIGPFNGGGQHASHLPFEEFCSLLENRVKVLFDETLCNDHVEEFKALPGTVVKQLNNNFVAPARTDGSFNLKAQDERKRGPEFSVSAELTSGQKGEGEMVFPHVPMAHAT